MLELFFSITITAENIDTALQTQQYNKWSFLFLWCVLLHGIYFKKYIQFKVEALHLAKKQILDWIDRIMWNFIDEFTSL